MKPCQGPKSWRVQRKRTPAPGYFTISAPTAMARGITKRRAPRTHSVSDPGPACAAAGIQRVPTMQLMAKRVMSRRLSSRRRWQESLVLSWGKRFRLSTCSGMHFAQFGAQFDADAAEAFGQEF